MWSLSPIGGQGALRALSLRENITSHEYAMVTYPTTNLSVAFARVPAPYKGASLINQMRAPIGAAFSTQDVTLLHSENTSQASQSAVERLGGMQEALKITQRDLWRNVRIPFLHMLEGYHPQFSEWLSVPGGTIPGYSSLIGVPIRGYPSMKSGNISFVIQTSYQVLDVSLSYPPSQRVYVLTVGSAKPGSTAPTGGSKITEACSPRPVNIHRAWKQTSLESTSPS